MAPVEEYSDPETACYGIGRLGPVYRPVDVFNKFDATGDKMSTKLFYPFYGATIVMAAVMYSQRQYKRPMFSQIWKHAVGMSGGAWFGWYAVNWSQEVSARRDAIIKHYMELHPDDFPPVHRKKFKNVLQEWFPAR